MHIFGAAIVAARFEDLLKILPVFLFLIFWVMGQIAEAKKKARAAKTGPQVPPIPGNKEAAAAPPDPLRQQVDEFLRRAGGQAPAPPAAAEAMATKTARPGNADRDRIEILVASDSASPMRPTTLPPRGAAAAPPPLPSQTQALSRAQRPPRRPRQSVAEHVAEHVTSAVKQMGDETARLGERVASVDRQFGAQLQQRFDHEIGTFADRRNARPTDAQPAAQSAENPVLEMAKLLSSGDGMRQAVVLNEIFRRPEERW
jgi:hypothetical protein